MKVTIELTRDDFADFNKYYFLKKGLKKRIYLVIFLALIIPLVRFINHPFDLVSYIQGVIPVGLVFGAFYMGMLLLIIKLNKRLPSKNGSILGKKTFTITEEGLMEESENNNNLQKWKGIQSVESNKKHLFIFVDSIAAYVIPKRYFKDEYEEREFLDRIEEKVKGSLLV